MADVKVSALAELAEGDLDPLADFLLVSDMSASVSKKMKASAMIRASLPYLTTAWDFTTGALSPTAVLTAASTRWRNNSSGFIAPATTDVARFQHDPVTLTSRGLLIEAARTELYTKNNTFSDAVWGKTGCTLAPNVVAGPDGTTSADEVIEDTSGPTHALGQVASTFTSGVTYVHRIFAKAKTRNWIAVYWDPNRFGGTGFCYFDLANGVVGTVSAGMTAAIRPAANGFYECIVIGTCTSSGAGNRSFWLSTADNGRIYTGDGTSSLYIWGASLQVGSEVTQHIATDASMVATAADVVTITNPYALTDQCWIIRGRTPRKISGGAANILLQVDDGTINNARRVYYEAGNYLCVSAVVAGVTTCFFNLGVVANDTDFALAVRWADNNHAVSLNAGAIVTDTSGANPLGLTTARIGSGVSGGYWNSTIRTIETRRTASDAELPLLAA